jgi:uncharacterized delta-60 repeat protein
VGSFTSFNGTPAFSIVRLNELDNTVIFTEQPVDSSDNLGADTTFSARASGSSFVTSYKWYFNGNPIADGADYSGVTTSRLTVLGVDVSDEGAYTVVATNAAGQSATSDSASLAVFGAPNINFIDDSPRVAFVGDSITLAAALDGAAPIDYEWFFDGNSIATGTQTVQSGTITYSIPSAVVANRGTFTIEVTNPEGSTTSQPLFLDVRENPTTLVPGFDGIASNSSGSITSIVPLADGGAYLAGSFSSWYFPTTVANYRGVVVRVDALGDLVTSFNPTISASLSIMKLGKMSDDSIVLSGTNISIDGATGQRLVKMDSLGVRDTSFTANIGTGPNGDVFALAVDAQDRIYVYGSFSSFNGAPTTGLVRLSAAGVRDASFNPALPGIGSVGSIQFGADGAIYLQHAFSIRKLSSQGVMDAGFNLGLNATGLAIDSQGRLLVASTAGIQRFSPAGVLDPSFDPTDSAVFMDYQYIEIDVDAEDRPLLLKQNFVTSFHLDGSRDLSFNGISFSGSFPNRDAATFEIGADGGIWVGGAFTSPKRKYIKYVGTPADVAITQQPAEAVVEPGAAASFTAGAIGTGPLSYQWYKDGVALSNDSQFSGVTTATLTLANAQEADEGNYTVQITNTLTTVSKLSSPAPLVVLGLAEFTTQPGSQAVLIDNALNLSASVQASAPYTVIWKKDTQVLSNGGGISGADTLNLSIASLPASGAGDYTVTVTNAFGSTESAVAKITTYLNPGQFAAGFVSPTFNSTILAILPLPSGQTLVGGQFSQVTDAITTYARTGLALVNADGTIDPDFSIAANTVRDMVLTADGKVLIAGQFTSVGGQSRPRHARLNSDLTLDSSYAPTATPNNTVFAILEDADGNVWIGGQFSSISGTPYSSPRLAKLDNTGMPVAGQVSPNNTVLDLLNAQDGDIFVAGTFSSFLGANPRLVKMNRDGTLDTAFDAGTFNSANSVSQSITGDVYVADFNNLVKLSSTGVQDVSFSSPWTSINQVNVIRVQQNGRVLSGFDRPPYFGRQGANGSIDPTFDIGSGVNGIVGAIALENTGAIWVGGQFTSFNGQTVGRLIRLEGDLVDISIRQNPSAQAVDVGTAATFTVVAETFAGETIGYQWRKDGVALVDGGDIVGATTATLTISNLDASDEGDYDVVATNLTSESDQTSSAAELIVLAEPEFLNLSTDQNLEVNNLLSVSVEARGAGTLTYQWQRNGVDIDGANSVTYEVTEAQVSDTGVYTVIVSNPIVTAGVASAPINVSVVLAPAAVVDGFDRVIFNSSVLSILPLVDGRTLVGGSFSQVTFDGVARSLRALALINADGSLDLTFNLNINSTVRQVRYDSQGRVLLGGDFTIMQGESRIRHARLDASLTLDPDFGKAAGPNGSVFDIVGGADGSVYLAGSFGGFDAKTGTTYVCRLYEDGDLDTSFVSTFNNWVYRIEVVDGGQLVAGGRFTATGRNYFARFNSDGSLDTTFAGGTGSTVYDFDRFSDGGWMVVGQSGAQRRFDAAGTLINTWSVAVNSNIWNVEIEDDDQVVIGGQFTNVAGQAVNRIARLNQDGTIDNTFTVGSGANNTVYALAIEPLGAIWIGGDFTEYRDAPATRIAKVVGDSVELAIVQSPSRVVIEPDLTAEFRVLAASADALTYQWLRDGVALTDGGDISGATTDTLQIANVEAADADLYSATVTNTATAASKSSSAAELLVLGAPEILKQPVGQTTEWKTIITFEVKARGIAPLSYQWYKDDVLIAADPRISGLDTDMLTISSTEVVDSGDYKVVVTNSAGSTTSANAAVAVFIPQGKQVPGVDLAFFNNTVRAVLPLGDGRALVGGEFTSPRPYLALINTDGSLDTSFNLGLNNDVWAIKVDRSGRILIGGDFTLIGGQPYQRVARLNADLTLDEDFEVLIGPNNTVIDLAEAADGSVWVGGAFNGTNQSGVVASNLMKFDSLGQVDPSLNQFPNSGILSVETLGDGHVLIGGGFTNFQFMGRSYLAKLTASGDVVNAYAPSIPGMGAIFRTR